MKTIGRYMFDVKFYKMVCISVFMLIPSFVLCFFPQAVSAVMLAWGALIMLRDLLKKQDFTKQTGSLLLLVFCLGYIITMLLYAKNDLVGTVHAFCWTVLEFFLLYRLDSDRENKPASLLEEIYDINIPIIWVALLTGLVSLVFFFTKTSIIMPDPEGKNRFWSMGIVNGRNSGVFNNAIPCANAMFLGVVCALYNLIATRKKTIMDKTLYVSTAAVCFLCVLTTLTRTYIYGVYFCIFVAGFVGVYLVSGKKMKNVPVRFVAALCAALVVTGLTVGAAEISKKTMVSLVQTTSINSVILNAEGFAGNTDEPEDTEPTELPPENTSEAPVTDPSETPPETEAPATEPAVDEEKLKEEISGQLGLYTDVDLNREELDRLPNFLYPRDELWKIALQVIPHSPILGFTTGNSKMASVAYGTTDYRVSQYPEGVTTYHNSYFDIGSAAGLLGLGLLLIFLGLQIVRALKVVFGKDPTVQNSRMNLCYGILVGYLATHVLITSMFFTALVFNNMCVCLYFWVVLGAVSKISDHKLNTHGVLSATALIPKFLKRK